MKKTIPQFSWLSEDLDNLAHYAFQALYAHHLNRLRRTEKAIRVAWPGKAITNQSIDLATSYFFDRVRLLAESILVIYEHHRIKWNTAARVLLRSQLESHLQLAYILQTKDLVADRSKLFLEYRHIEVEKYFRKLQEHSRHAYARMLSQNNYQFSDTVEINARNARDYAIQNGHKYSGQTWHGMTLDDLAKKIGNLEEVAFLAKILHHANHGSALDAFDNASDDDKYIIHMALSYFARSLLVLLEWTGIEIAHEDLILIQDLGKPMHGAIFSADADDAV